MTERKAVKLRQTCETCRGTGIIHIRMQCGWPSEGKTEAVPTLCECILARLERLERFEASGPTWDEINARLDRLERGSVS